MEPEAQRLVESFKQANQSLRKRAIALGILMILVVALQYIENDRFTKVSGLIEYQSGLEGIMELPDTVFKGTIDAGVRGSFFPSQSLLLENEALDNVDPLFNKVKFEGYKKDRIYDEIDEIDQKIEVLNQQRSIGILGLTIPLEPVAYLSLVFVLIVFHDFTQIMTFRNQIYRRIRGQNLPPWELGFEFFGFFNPVRNSSLKFLKFTSSIITAALIICPLVTSYLMMNLNNSNSDFLFFLNAICFVLIVIDTIIIFHTENYGNFRYFCNFYLGRHNISKSKMRLVWAGSLSLVLAANFIIGIFLIGTIGMAGLLYCAISIVPPTLLFFSLVSTQNNSTKKRRAIRASLILFNVIWLITTVQGFSILNQITERKVTELGLVLFFAIVLCFSYGLIYWRFFMDNRRRKTA